MPKALKFLCVLGTGVEYIRMKTQTFYWSIHLLWFGCKVFPQNSWVEGLFYKEVVPSDDGQIHNSWAMAEILGGWTWLEELSCCRCKFKVYVCHPPWHPWLSLSLLCGHHAPHAHSLRSASSQAQKQQGPVTMGHMTMSWNHQNDEAK